MPEIKINSIASESTSTITLNSDIFAHTYHSQAIYNVVNAQLAAMRQGTHDTKTRSEVRGGGKKPYKQKGTGNARQGSTRAVQWRGGGISMGPTPRKYNLKINKKVKKLAYKCALSSHVENETILILDSLKLTTAKTKEVQTFLKKVNIDNRVLFVYSGVEEGESLNFFQAARNIPYIYISEVSAVSTYDILHAKNLILTCKAVEWLEETLDDKVAEKEVNE